MLPPLADITLPGGSQIGQRTRAPWRADCAGPKHFSGHSALRSHLNARAEKETALFDDLARGFLPVSTVSTRPNRY